MTLRLILMRHAKSSWTSGAEGDHARPLNGRGRRSAGALGEWLRAHGYLPDAILSSSSERTHETAARLALIDVPATFTDALYHAGPSGMLEVLSKAEGRCVLMLGHKPGIGEFADMLVTTPPGHAGFVDYPTGATLVVEFEAETWAEVRFGTGRAVDFTVPRDLLA